MTRPPVYDDLPAAVWALVPELATMPRDEEKLADCSRCVRMAAHNDSDPSKPWAFDPEVRCCTFSPTMPNILVGRALRRGGVGAELMRKRIALKRDMTAWGLFPGEAFDVAYEEGQRRFGRAVELTCPFWSPGEFSCGIWHDRPPVCRTWHCKYTRGDDGREQWARVRTLLDRVLNHISMAAAAAGRPPILIDPASAWEAWYIWCADWVDANAAMLPELLRDANMDAAVAKAVDGVGAQKTIPDLLVSSLSSWEPDGERLYLVGYNLYDGVFSPPYVFAFLSRLDGLTPWRDALGAANATLGTPLPESLVLELFRVGAVRSPLEGDRPDDAPASFPMG